MNRNVQCPQCSKKFRIEKETQKLKCPHCKETIRLPEETPERGRRAPKESELQIHFCSECKKRTKFVEDKKSKVLECIECGFHIALKKEEPEIPTGYGFSDDSPEPPRTESKERKAKGDWAAETLHCPICDRMERNDAETCHRCGYNFETQEREDWEIPTTTWDFGLPLWARATMAGFLTFAYLPILIAFPNSVWSYVGIACWVLFLVLGFGTFNRLKLVTNKKNEPLLLTNRRIAFIPFGGEKLRLWKFDFTEVRYTGVKTKKKNQDDPGAKGSAFFAIFLVIVLILLCSAGFIPGLLFWFALSQSLNEGEGSLGGMPRMGWHLLYLSKENRLEKNSLIYKGLALSRINHIRETLKKYAGIKKHGK